MFAQGAYYTGLSGLPPPQVVGALVERIYGQVFRHDFASPGAALVSLGNAVRSAPLRQFMIVLKEALGELYQRQTGKHLVYLSLARFNQQATTKFHLDGAPEEAYLMLGYEPTVVQSALSIADYTRAAHECGIEPKVLLSDFNPMYADHERRLSPYVTRLEGFDPSLTQILLINNSSLPYRADRKNVLGVMHQATILTPLPTENRVVNSTMMGSAAHWGEEPAGKETQQRFVATQEIAGEVVG
jgi:hypothetical protein